MTELPSLYGNKIEDLPDEITARDDIVVEMPGGSRSAPKLQLEIIKDYSTFDEWMDIVIRCPATDAPLYIVKEVVLQKVTRGMKRTKPLRLSKKSRQDLFDELWHSGCRPKKGWTSEEESIKDLRSKVDEIHGAVMNDEYKPIDITLPGGQTMKAMVKNIDLTQEVPDGDQTEDEGTEQADPDSGSAEGAGTGQAGRAQEADPASGPDQPGSD